MSNTFTAPPSLQWAPGLGPTATGKAEANGSHGGGGEVKAMGAHLSDQLRVLESMLSRRPLALAVTISIRR